MKNGLLEKRWESGNLVGLGAGGKSYVWNVGTISVFEVDDLADEMLRYRGAEGGPSQASMMRFAPEDIERAALEIAELEEQGLLAAAAPHETTPGTFGTLELHVSHLCNMECIYCFASQGDYGTGAGLMSEETAHRALEFFFGQLGDRPSGSIVFFGGEPLVNFGVMKSAVEYADALARSLGKKVEYSTTVNGSLLSDEVIDFLNVHNVSTMISIDGPPEVQDMQRPFKGGRPSYEVIVPKVQKLIDSRNGRLTARATVCHGGSGLVDTVRHLAEVGFDQVFCSPVSCDSCDRSLALDASDVAKIAEEYAGGVREILASGVTGPGSSPLLGLYNMMMIGLREGQPRSRACGAGVGIITVTPDGEFYPCHRFVGREAWRMGTLDDGPDFAIRERMLRFDVAEQPTCGSCWLRHACGGACLNELATDEGGFGEPDPVLCAISEELTSAALALYVQLESRRTAQAADDA